MFVNDPLGGEPTAVVAISSPAEKPDSASEAQQQHSHHDGTTAVAAPANTSASAGAVSAPAGSKTITIIDGSSGKHQDVIIPGKSSGNASRAPLNMRFVENTHYGAIPKIAPDGMRPFRLYAHPREMPAGKDDAPRIAIIVGGLGISASGTADALAKLPAPVTLAIAPYGADLDDLAERAQAGNHEVLLQAPMEPFDYPDNDPGPQTLLTSLTPEQNIDRLHWLMSRFQGYVGIVSYMGARFTASETGAGADHARNRQARADLRRRRRLVAQRRRPVRRQPELAVRQDRRRDRHRADGGRDRPRAGAAGDDGTRSWNRGRDLPPRCRVPSTRIAEWAKKAEARGFVLVPITMVAVKEKSS